ncbi:MAG: serine/threonine protein kinase [Polyangiaceae bacterium]|nr:serine/threonine protein kinase [Polyangiaceae bacterium]
MTAPQIAGIKSEVSRMEGTDAASGALGKYRLIAELGHGGMAQVFLATARGPAGFNKLAVIKQIREQLADDPEFLTMFLDEARLAARLNHPNVVQTNEVGEDGKRYFICMEYLEGQPLNRIIQRLGRENGLPLGLTLRILVDALAGLHHAHELADYDGTALQVVHRDVTPHNIFVTYAGQVKVVDFGIAKALSQSAETKAGVLKGKVAYMAPEQARGDKVDRRADIFSVGVIMWEALAGRRMFKGLTDVVIIQKIVNGQLQSPRSANPSVNEKLDAVCMKALAHNREDRYETAADFAAAIEEALEATGDRSNLRDAGKLIQAAFEAERSRIKSLVEATLSGTPRTSGEFPAETSSIGKFNLGVTSGQLPIIADPLTGDGDSHSEHAAPLVGAVATGSHRTQSVSAEGTLTSSALTPKPPEQKKNKLLLPLIVVGAIAAAGIGYVALGNKPPPPQPVATPTPTPTQAKSKFSLKLESTPPGATVKEGEQELGKTPMAITLDGNSKDTRVFTVSLDGYLDYTFRQEPATEDVKFVAALTKREVAPPPGTEPTVAPGGRPRHYPTTPATTPTAVQTPPPPNTSLDIKLNR